MRKRIYNIADRHQLSKGAMASLVGKIRQQNLNMVNEQERMAVTAIEEILLLAREDLRTYLDDCKKRDLKIENIQKMMALLKCGYHTIPLLKEKMKMPIGEIKKEIKNYCIVYYYPKQEIEEKKFKIEDPQKIVEWIEKHSEIEAKIDGESLWITSKDKKILQFKFHWRNVFFGIATPSVEIFDKTYLD